VLQRLPAGLAVVLDDGDVQPLDLAVDALDLLVEEFQLVVGRIALRVFAPELLRERAVGGPGRQPFGALGDPALAEFALVSLFQLHDDRTQRPERVETFAHLADRLVDVAIGLDRLAQLADSHIVLLEDVIAHELRRRLVVVQCHGIDDRLLQRVRVLLAGGGVRHQMAHVFADVVDCPVTVVDEIPLADGLHDACTDIVPFGREPPLLADLDEVLRREDLADRDKAAEHRLVAVRSSGLDRHADGDRRALALRVGEAERDVGACLLAPPLVLAERTEAVVDDAALGGAAALSLVTGDRVEPLDIAIAAGEHDLGHVKDGRLAGPVLAEHAGVTADLDVLDVEQVPVHHRDVPELHHASSRSCASADERASSCLT
jgi:hypothetical protein